MGRGRGWGRGGQRGDAGEWIDGREQVDGSGEKGRVAAATIFRQFESERSNANVAGVGRGRGERVGFGHDRRRGRASPRSGVANGDVIVPGNPVETRTRGSILARAVRARRCARELIGGRSVGGVASRVVGRSRTVVDAEYLEPPGVSGSPRGCVPVPGRANHRGEPRRSPRATPQPGPRSPPVPSRRTRGVGGLSSRVRRCDGRGARRHRRRRRHRHRGRARGTPIRPCVSRARALSDARRVVEIQQRRGRSRASRFKKIPQPIESLKIWRAVLTCQVLSWTLPLFRSAPKLSSCRVGAAGGMPGGGPGWFAVRSSSGTLTTRPSRGSFSN
jgi:hypothetical protein